MKIRIFSFAATLGLLTQQVSAQTSDFVYQGLLKENGAAANGTYQMQIVVRDVFTNQVGSAFAFPVVGVTNGLFNLRLDFGTSPFDGSVRFFEVGVRTNGSVSPYTILSPRQEITSAIYAIQARNAETANNVLGNITDSQLSSNIPRLNSSPNFSGTVTVNAINGNGAGLTNVNSATLNGLSSGAFWKLGGNTGVGTNFLGTTDNTALDFRVNGVRALRIQPDATSPNLIGGHFANTVTNLSFGSTIGGGGDFSFPNLIASSYSFIGGGYGNTIEPSAVYGVIGGGSYNTLDTNAYEGTIAGGSANTVLRSGPGGFVGGGFLNTVGSENAVIAGGSLNYIGAGSETAVIGGGKDNTIDSYTLQSTISGGLENLIETRNDSSTIAGGANNTIEANSYQSVISGGSENHIYGEGATIAGGARNTNYGFAAVIGGGLGNRNISSYGVIGGGSRNTNAPATLNATIPGGSDNFVSGNYGFAAGHRAKAISPGTFVWADSSNADFASTSTNQFLIRASGGVGIGTNNPSAPLHVHGNARVTGLLRSGSETGSSHVPNPAGLVIRRINSTASTVGSVIARTDLVTLERDGTAAGLVIRYPVTTVKQTVSCTGIDKNGTPVGFYQAFTPAGAGTVQICTDVQRWVKVQISFGNTYNQGGHVTQVTLDRYDDGATSDNYWMGTLTSTFNQ